jgi:hypothetical protein
MIYSEQKGNHGDKSEAKMSRYDPLRDYLQCQSADRIQLSFSDIEDEDRIGVKLPRSAKESKHGGGTKQIP